MFTAYILLVREGPSESAQFQGFPETSSCLHPVEDGGFSEPFTGAA